MEKMQESGLIERYSLDTHPNSGAGAWSTESLPFLYAPSACTLGVGLWLQGVMAPSPLTGKIGSSLCLLEWQVTFLLSKFPLERAACKDHCAMGADVSDFSWA